MAYDWTTLRSNSADYGKISKSFWDLSTVKLNSLYNSTSGHNTCPSYISCTHNASVNSSQQSTINTSVCGGNHGYDSSYDSSDKSNNGYDSDRRSDDRTAESQDSYHGSYNARDWVNNSTNECLPAGTLIQISLDGKKKPVEELKPGDTVISLDTNSGELRESTLKECNVYSTESLVIVSWFNRFKKNLNPFSLTMTASHPIYTNEGWAAVNPEVARQNLNGEICIKLDSERNLKIMTEDGWDDVISVKEFQCKEEITVYSPVVETYHNYFANGVLVHNKQGETPL